MRTVSPLPDAQHQSNIIRKLFCVSILVDYNLVMIVTLFSFSSLAMSVHINILKGSSESTAHMLGAVLHTDVATYSQT